MLFSSYSFLFVFLPVTLAGFGLLSRHQGPKAAKLWLVLASLCFYGWWNPIYVGLIAVSMLFNFTVGRQIGRRVRAGRGAAGALFLGVAVNLALLGYFKYAHFFVNSVNAAVGFPLGVGPGGAALGHLVFHLYADRLLGGCQPGRGL